MLTIRPKKMQIRNSDGEFEEFPAIGGGEPSDTTVTAESIKSALGYTPANKTDVDSIKDTVNDIKNDIGEAETLLSAI